MTSPREDSSAEARTAAYRLMFDEARRAIDAGNEQRFDTVLSRLLDEVRPESEGPTRSDLLSEEETRREARMDAYRIATAILLVTALFASVIWALSQGGENGQANAQYVSLISGLAGIAIGWLYGSSSSARRLTKRSRRGDESEYVA